MKSRVILLVEDNPDDEALTIRALKKNNIDNDVVVARDGVEALVSAKFIADPPSLFGTGDYEGRDVSVQPQLTLLDLKLPKIDGLEVLRQIRRNELTKFNPVVVLTSSSEQRDIHQSYDEGVNSYIRKPVDFEQFLQAVNQLGLYWLLLNITPDD